MNLKRIATLALASLALGIGAISHASPAKATTSKIMPAKMEKMMASVNVNTASTKQLETLPGVGPRIAAQIIKNRPYKDAKAFQSKIKGIGPKTWARMKKHVSFK